MSQTLFGYMQQVQRFIRDAKQEQINPQDIITYVNVARREVAMRSQCIRVLTPITGSITTATIVNPGVGYSSTSYVSVNAPDFPSGQLPYPNGLRASISAVVNSGTLANVAIDLGGYGYFKPTATLVDPTGVGSSATIALSVSSLNLLNQGQEVYSFASVDLSSYPGYGSIYLVRSVSVIFTNWRYSLPCYSFSVYQAQVRQYAAGQYQYIPAVCGQFGRGTGGTFYMYPVPSQTFQMEWDASCLPQDLTTDQSVEAIPDPWTDAVPYFAAHLAYLELQNFNYARAMEDEFDRRMMRYSQYAQPGRRTNPYGRW